MSGIAAPSSPRYAIYFAPAPDSALWRFGSRAVGYDAATGRDAPFPDHPFYASPSIAEWTEEPRRYGFHATLKAPFSLAEDESEQALLSAVHDFAARRSGILDVRLGVHALGRFLALTPMNAQGEINRLAADCVTAFERFRAPLSDSDRARRLKAPLTVLQKDYLDRYGYPYVLDEFRFHMTLTGALSDDARTAALAALRALYQPIDAPTELDAICVFRQEKRDSRFRILSRAPLLG
ncbi:MAG: hypothetical protein BGP06_17515 [Rhizobiales bacterium 65-9]|nr:MAG: hypothetical protein BGP06_17515 [Rhizobiales bacterium 65-9]